MMIKGATTGTKFRGAVTGQRVRSNTVAEMLANRTALPAGTLGGAAIAADDGALAGLAAGAGTIDRFTVAADPAYTRNASNWAAGFDLSCFSATEGQPGTLISPRHVIGANHYAPASTLRFVAADGSVVSRNVTALQRVGVTDIIVGVLDSDVPAGVTFARLLPADFRSWLPSSDVNVPVRIPVAAGNQFRALRVMEWVGPTGGIASCEVPTVGSRPPFGTATVTGDSGNPMLLLLGTSLPPVMVTHFTGVGGGEAYADHLDGISAAMVALGGGYTAPTTIDLSGYAVN